MSIENKTNDQNDFIIPLKELEEAMSRDFHQQTVNSLTPDRGYDFPTAHVLELITKCYQAAMKRCDPNVWICGQLTGEYVGRGTPWEFQGVFSEKSKAIGACQNQNYFVFPATMNKELPDDPIDAPGAFYPKADTKTQI